MFNLGKGGNKVLNRRKGTKCLLVPPAVNSLALPSLTLFLTPPGLGLQNCQSWILSPWWPGSCWWVEGAKALIWGFTYHHAPVKWPGPASPCLTCSQSPPVQKRAGGECELRCPFRTWLILSISLQSLHTTGRWISHNIQWTIMKCTMQGALCIHNAVPPSAISSL